MEILRSTREEAGILPENPFFFALPGKTESYLDPFRALNHYVKRSVLEMPEMVTSTRLRKYLGEHHIHCFNIIITLWKSILSFSCENYNQRNSNDNLGPLK